MSKVDHETLKQLAEAATPGPWFRKDAENNGTYGHEWIDASEDAPAYKNGYSDIADCSGITKWQDRIPLSVDTDQIKANAAYIAAANPQAVLDLIAEVERLRDEAARPIDDESELAKARGEWNELHNRHTELTYKYDALEADVARLTQERDEAREALAPFAKEGDRIPARGQDDVRYEAGCDEDACPIYSLFTVKDLRRAAAIVKQGEKG